MSITIRDVARRLNLSITTVSRALDGYPDVSAETRRLVQQTAQEMGYSPNQAARQLRRRRADSIGYILPARRPRFADPYFAEFVAGLGDEAVAQGVDLLVASAAPDSLEERQIYERWVHSRKVDGVVLNRLRRYDWRVQYLGQSSFPFVAFERSLDALAYPAIEMDNRAWFERLTQHLLDLGHRRIAYIGAAGELKIQLDRLTGYQQALQAAGLPLDPALVVATDMTRAGGAEAAAGLLALPDPPTAIACVDDLTALGVLQAARAAGLALGRDLAVAGFDGIEAAAYADPPLTTVNQPVYQIARRLVQMLAAQMTGKPAVETTPIEAVLELRPSTLGKE